ncbi:MAG: hypothetical protein LQ338_004840, partial [Usnochroma carphineum]
MANRDQRNYNWPPDNGPPNGGIPPGTSGARQSIPFPQLGQIPSSNSLPPQSGASSPLEPPGGHFHGYSVEVQGVRALFPLRTAVFHVMNRDFMKGLPSGYMQPWEFPTGLTVRDFCVALGIRGGISECHEMGDGTWMHSQTFLPGDTRAGKTLEEVGWTPGRGIKSKPIWIEVLEHRG